MHLFPKRLLALTLFAALAVMPTCVLRAQWVPANGPYQPFKGIIRSIAAIGDTIFTCDDWSGLYRSTNAGTSWTLVNNLEADLLFPFGQSLLAGSYGVYQSSDYGANWTLDTAGVGYGEINCICANGSTLYTGGASHSVSTSTNGGASWSTIGTFSNSVSAIAISGPKLLAGIYWGSGIFSSIDNGAHWTQDTLGMGVQPINCLLDAGASLLAGCGDTDGVYRSTDHGGSWFKASNGLTNKNVICLARMGSNLFAGTTGGGVFISTNDGSNWKPASAGLPSNTFVENLLANGNDLFATTDSTGIYLSTDDGTSWNSVSPGPYKKCSVSTLVAGAANIFAGVKGSGVFRSSDDGMNWTDFSSLPSYDGVYPRYRDYVLTLQGNDLYVGTGGGLSIFPGSDPLQQVSIKQGLPAGVPVTLLLTSGNSLFAAFDYGAGVFRSTNGGMNWNKADNGISGFYIQALMTDGTDLYAGFTGMYRSTDSGVSWNWTSDSIPPRKFNPWIESLVTTGNDFYAGGGSMYLSTDAGSTWSEIHQGLIGETTSALITTGNYVFCGSDSGVFLLTDGDTTWKSVSDGLPAGDTVYVLAVHGQTLIAGTSEGVWLRPLSEMLGSNAVKYTPDRGSSLITYPNPFSQSTQITFTSQAAGYAEVSIMNMLGVEVARLFSGELGAGEHSFLWGNPNGLPDGVYECLVRMNGQVETVPVVKF
jgi:photosystem II stability/assembly factor-like uncharacterized protein